MQARMREPLDSSVVQHTLSTSQQTMIQRSNNGNSAGGEGEAQWREKDR